MTEALTRRDIFAAIALHALLGRGYIMARADEHAGDAIKLADALLAALDNSTP